MQVINRFKSEIDNQKVRITVATINADDATELLVANTDNRKLRTAKIEEYRRAMNRGDFLFNGDAIRVGTVKGKNVLLDGQHRLEALLAADEGVTITTLIVEGLDPEARNTIDVGAPRTAANLLEFGGEDRMVNAVNMAALARAALIMEGQTMPSKLEVVQFAKANQAELERAYRHGVHAIEGSPLKGGVTPYALAAWFIGKAEPNGAMIEYFFQKLASGEGLFHGDPILALRNRLVASPPDTAGGSRHRYTKNSAMFIRAWNAFAAGQNLTYIRGWGENQSFPEAKPVADKIRDEFEGQKAS